MRNAFENRETEEGEEGGGGESGGPVEDDAVPGYVMNRLEGLFRATARNRAKAGQLKEELDRWGLYELYEDRFLDLFRNREQDEDEDRP